MAAPLILNGCDVLVGPDLRHVRDVRIRVEDGLIVDVSPSGGQSDGIDARGYLVIPGMINCHTHIGDAAFFGRAFGVDPDRLLWPPDGLRHQWMTQAGDQRVVDGIASALEVMVGSGTVLFADFREQGAAGVKLLREAVSGSDVEAMIFGRHESFPVHSEEDLQANTAGLSARQLADIANIVGIADGFSPLWANETTDRGLQQTAQVVRDRGGRLATHAGETPDYRALSKQRTGAGDIERIIRFLAPDFVVHLTSATTAEMELLVEAGVPGVMCPSTQAALGIGIPPLVQAVSAGLPIGLGTDNAMMTMPDLLGEMGFFYRALRGANQQTAGPTARQVLRAATIDAASVLGVSDTHGHLDVGRPAHLCVIDTTGPAFRQIEDPVVGVVCAASAHDVHLTVIGGQMSYLSPLFRCSPE